jgi:oligopeptide transport system substrate-binding protein
MMRVLVLLALAFALHGADEDWKRKYAPPTLAYAEFAQEFVFNNGTEPETLDPGLMTGVPESRIATGLFEGLVTLDPGTLEPRPGIAESWEISADGLTYTFHLRESRWSDGRSLTAKDFMESWRRVLSTGPTAEAPQKKGTYNARPSAYAYQLYPISKAEEFHKGTLTDFTQVGINVVDDRTLRVTLKQPCAYFLDLAAFHTLMPTPVDLVERFGERWIRPENMVCNGPYKLSSWEPRRAIVLVKNEQYWDTGYSKLTKITALPYDDLEAAYKLYQEGGIHWMPGIPALKQAEVSRLADYYVSPYFGTYFYRFNTKAKPFDDKRVRRVFALAVDRAQITEQILKGGEQPAGTICPAIGAYKPASGVSYDRDQARELLKQAGYSSETLPVVELLFNTSERHKQIAEAVAQQWKTVLGVNVSLRNSEWKTYLSDVDNGNFQIARASWIGDYNDPNTFFDLWVTNGGNNRTHWSNAEYDKLLAQSQNETDSAKRMLLFEAMDAIMTEECPVVPVYRYVNQGLLRETVNGMHDNIRDHHPYQFLWIQ